VTSTLLTVFSLTILHAAIFALIIIIKKKDEANALEKKWFKNTFGAITDGLTLKNFAGKYWNLISLIRWTVVSIILVVL
jgi:hypothetical protein